MTISGGKSTGLWTGGTVVLLLLSMVVLRIYSSRSDATEDAYTVRDSAGVEIVANLRPAWGEGEGWQVGSEPLLRIGVVEGEEAYQFSGLTGMVRMADGTMVVADFGAQDVRFFGPDGTVRTLFGGPGGGPGEFTGLAALGLSPEGLVWAYDFSLRRITWLDGTGSMVHLTSMDPEPPTLNAVGALPGGVLLLKQLWGAEEVATASSSGLRRDRVAFVTFDSTGALLDTLGLFPGRGKGSSSSPWLIPTPGQPTAPPWPTRPETSG